MNLRTRRAPRCFGVEEEYLLLDTATGAPSNRSARLIQDMPHLRHRAEHELLSSQLETSTPVCHDAVDAEAVLTEFRASVSSVAARQHTILAGTGLPPVGGEAVATVTPKPRYLAISAMMRDAVAHQYATGTHVHVEVPSRDVGVEVLVRLARWTPVLLALTANSPIWMGEPTGFSSWRHMMNLSWPVSGYPPPFTDGDHYGQVLAQLVASGIILDSAMVSWSARLSERYPTVELRIADAQLTAEDAVAFAVLVRALIDHCVTECERGVERPVVHHNLVNGAIWAAARDGLSAELVDPVSGIRTSAFELVNRMVETVSGELTRFGDMPRIERYLQRRYRDGGPAQLQLQSFAADGLSGLLDLYRSGSAAPLQAVDTAWAG